MDTAQEAPNTVILAQDEASLYLQATIQVVWHQRGQTPVIKLDPSRKSVHFYGALDLRNGQETAMMSPIMNGATTALFLQKLLLTYPDQRILLLWDRAPWHSGAPINELLEANPRLEILRFPPGSPDLNPQEHVWKAARTAISHNHRFARLEPLADAFLTYLTQTRFPSSMLDLYGYNQISPMFI
jgi:transposase